jgi:predicted PurR-regulated permease PerM
VKQFFSKHWQLIVFIVGLIFVCWLIWTLRNVLLPFIVGLILAYLLLPVIRWVEKRLLKPNEKPKIKQLKRIAIILIIYLLSIIIIGLAVFYIFTIASKAIGNLLQNAPQTIPDGLAAITNWLKSLKILSNPTIQQNIDDYITKAGAALPGVLSNFLSTGVKIIQSSTSLILGFIIMPIFIFFLLKDWDNLRDKFYAGLPQWARIHTKNFFSILQTSIIHYIRGSLILALIVAILTYIFLTILRIDFALPLAVFIGITELVPLIGPWLGGALAVIVTLATAPGKAIWVIIGYLVILQIENQLIGPKIRGSQMEIHPAFLIILTVLGAYFAGILGLIIVLPLTMVVLKTFKYLRDSVRDGTIS